MNTTRRRFLGMGAALAVVPKTVLAAPDLGARIVLLQAQAFREASVTAGDYYFAAGSYAALLCARPGYNLIVSGLGDDNLGDEDDAG